MPIDMRKAAVAAAEAALREAASDNDTPTGKAQRRSGKQKGKAKKPLLSPGRAMLLGAGLLTAGRALASSRGREFVGSVHQFIDEHRTEDGEYDEEEYDGEYDDEEPEAAADEEFDDDVEDPEDEEELEDEEPEAEGEEGVEDDDLDDEDPAEPEDQADGPDEEDEAEEKPASRRRSRRSTANHGRG